jgi:hypothetical protein
MIRRDATGRDPMIELPSLLADTSPGDAAIVVVVVLARLIIPLFIPQWPLVILGALVLDAADQTIFQLWTDLNTTETGPYQAYDKALDNYYLSIAFVSTLRNWKNNAAIRTGQFLFFYRLVGATLFELTHWRPLLLIFPNTFEYFFIAYEVLRTRDPAKASARYWILWAAGIWIFVKLPQEWWIHIAKLDTTDVIRAHPWIVPIVVAVIGFAAYAYLKWIKPRRAPQDYPFRYRADPLPTQAELAAERRAQMLRRGKVLTPEVFEKIVLVTLLTIIFSQIAPNVDASPGQIAVGVASLVILNTAVSLWAVRRGRARLEWTIRAFIELQILNIGLMLVFAFLERGDDDFDAWSLLFFSYLITLIIVLYDRYRSVYVGRFGGETGEPPGFRSVASDAWHYRPGPGATPRATPPVDG